MMHVGSGDVLSKTEAIGLCISTAPRLNNAMPQAIDRRTNAGFIVSGLWNSLGDVLGAASFDDDKKGNRWSFFFESRCSLWRQ